MVINYKSSFNPTEKQIQLLLIIVIIYSNYLIFGVAISSKDFLPHIFYMHNRPLEDPR